MRIRKPHAPDLGLVALHGVRERVPGIHAPMWSRAFVRLHWRRLCVGVVGLVGLVVQMWLLWAAGQLVDLCLSLMEVWAELARKHLEITS